MWYEYNANDPAKAVAFYKDVVGWNVTPWGGEGYQMLAIGDPSQGGIATGGIMAMPEGAKAMNAPSHWMGWVAVADLDATLAKVAELGGQTLAPPFVVPTVGRLAVFADNGGAALGVIQAEGNMHPPVAQADKSPQGAFVWHELMAGDREQALAFYGGLFGWQASEKMDMPDGSVYQLFTGPGGSNPIGGMMTKPDEMPVAAFCYYTAVDDLDGAVGRATARGAHVIMGPMQVPGGSRIVMAADDQGGMFALLGA